MKISEEIRNILDLDLVERKNYGREIWLHKDGISVKIVATLNAGNLWLEISTEMSKADC